MNLAKPTPEEHPWRMPAGNRIRLLSLLAGLAVACLVPGWLRDDPARLVWLTHPAAWLAAHLLVIPVDLAPAQPPLLLHASHSLRVVDGCSGADFFGLLTGLLVWGALAPRRWWLLALVLPLSYGLTVMANAARLVTVLLAEIHLATRMPDYLHGSLHAATGVLVFLPLMIGTYALWERMVRRDCQPA